MTYMQSFSMALAMLYVSLFPYFGAHNNEDDWVYDLMLSSMDAALETSVDYGFPGGSLTIYGKGFDCVESHPGDPDAVVQLTWDGSLELAAVRETQQGISVSLGIPFVDEPGSRTITAKCRNGTGQRAETKLTVIVPNRTSNRYITDVVVVPARTFEGNLLHNVRIKFGFDIADPDLGNTIGISVTMSALVSDGDGGDLGTAVNIEGTVTNPIGGFSSSVILDESDIIDRYCSYGVCGMECDGVYTISAYSSEATRLPRGEHPVVRGKSNLWDRVVSECRQTQLSTHFSGLEEYTCLPREFTFEVKDVWIPTGAKIVVQTNEVLGEWNEVFRRDDVLERIYLGVRGQVYLPLSYSN